MTGGGPLTELTQTSLRINAPRVGRFSIPRPRSLGEFVLHPGRWSVPNVKNVTMLTRRIKTNLLYFQTNYLIVSLIAFAAMILNARERWRQTTDTANPLTTTIKLEQPRANLVALQWNRILSMKTLLTGIVSSIIIIIAVLFFFEHIPQARQIKQNHPTLVIIGGIVLIIVTWHALHTILWVIGAALVPVPFWLLHAALRSSNGLIDSQRQGSDNFVDTPVGQLLQMVGVEPRASLHE